MAQRPYSSNIGRILNENTFFAEDLAGDTDIEVIITDSRNCTASVIINHSCGPDLSFRAQIGCANADNFAPVQIIASGGTAPYEVQVDSEPFVVVGDPIFLPAGKHTLVVRDATGTMTPSQDIEIQVRLDLSEPNFDCIGENNQYIVDMRVSGGQPPYGANRGTIQGNSYFSDLLPGDTDTEIIISDSRKCTVTRIVNHSCSSGLSFNTNIGCTSANGAAMVEIIPSGGIAPYEIQSDTQPFIPLTDPITLPSGTHQLTLRDSTQATVSQTITVPDALALEVLKLSCESENKQYRASIRISGGTPPYIAAGVPVTGDIFDTEPIPSGEPASIQVFDSNKCNAVIDVQHNCEEPCDLPCDGETMQCAYRLWLQPPSKTEPYEIYQTLKEVNFRFNGKNINIPNSVDLLQITTAQLNRNFNNAMAGAVKKLNEAINQALTGELGDAGNNRLQIFL